MVAPRVRQAALLAASLVAGCGEASDPADMASDATDGSDETRYAPVFNQPADGLLEINTNRREDSFLSLKFIYLGLTSLLVDDTSAGPMSTLGRVGQLSPEMIQLNFHGGMVAGRHAMQLFTPGTTRGLFSQTITVQISAGSSPVPQAALTPTTLANIAAVDVWGYGDRAGVVAIEDGDVPRAHLIPVDGGQLDQADAVVVDLPGYVVSHWDDGRPAVAVESHGPVSRVAWTAGIPGDRVEARDVDLDSGATGDPVTVLSLVPALTGPAEWAELGRVVLADATVLAELRAHLDVEQPVPGERVLASVQLADGPSPGLPQRLELAGPRDLDGLGPATNMADLRLQRAPLTFGIRVDGVRASVLDVHPTDGTVRLRGSVASDSDLALAGLAGDVRAIEGAFGSRTTFGRDGDRFMVLLADDDSDNGVSRIEASLPDTTLTGPPAFGVLLGSPVILLPFGPGSDVQTLTSDGASLDASTLDGVACDQVAIAPDLRGNTDGTLPMVCLRGGDVHLGQLAGA